MTEVLRSPSHLPSSPSRPSLSCDTNDGSPGLLSGDGIEEQEEGPGVVVDRKRERRRRGEEEAAAAAAEEEGEQLPVLALLLAVVRKSLLGCKTEGAEELRGAMEIGWPTDVRHVAHVTFDRFRGFLGLPIEFEPEVPRRPPSASASVFGVSTVSMQCSYDSRGNSIPTILLLMQKRLYEQGGLQAEGIFRINAENSQEEYVRDQLNRGMVPDGIDVHCLAGLIKAWFRELPTGLLDSLSPEQVMQCQSEEDCAQLARLLPPTEAALLDWAINLMADVVQEEQLNKMNAHNIAMVFAPNMTQMADPLTALMHAVQVMNFLKMLILKTLKERQEPTLEDFSVPHLDPSDENGHHSPQLHLECCREEATDQVFVPEEPALGSPTHLAEENTPLDEAADSSQTTHDNAAPEGTAVRSTDELFCETPAHTDGSTADAEIAANGSNAVGANSRRTRTWQSSSFSHKKGSRKAKGNSAIRGTWPTEKSKGASIVSRINSKVERVEAWR
ncbi:rho GTPase-activating protein 1 [Elaeis guineensis]|uniref:Rho GTPase-activating protein 1 n=1 Tax=Elaeis guineensis var. tenera TaxID=51953 RepID=A0A6I9QRR4_ELAGV|nr:rho GTPase-activating protein 1 [Elaeis guineensis]